MTPPTFAGTRHGEAGAAVGILMFLAAVIVAVVVLIPKLLREDEKPASDPTATVAVQSASRPEKLNPDPYRTQIMAMEKILYKRSPANWNDGDKIADQAMKLSMSVRGDRRSPKHAQAFIEICNFAQEADVVSDVGYAMPNLSELRAKWEPLRDAVFTHVSWFQGTTGWRTAVQSQSDQTDDAASIRALIRLCAEIESLISRGQQEAMAIGEAAVDAGALSPPARAEHQRWKQWCKGWLDRVQTVAEHFPERPGRDADINVIMVYQQLGQAIHDLRLVPIPAGSTTAVPRKYERERRFASASWHVQQAGEYLAKATP